MWVMKPLVAAAAVTFTLVGCGGGSPSPSPAAPSPAPSVETLTYTVQGKQIVASDGSVYVPYGVELLGLEGPNNQPWQDDSALPYMNQAQMQAAVQIWHANTIRIQAVSQYLFDQQPYDAQYLNFMDNEVQWAHQYGANVIIALQYEVQPNPQPLPTQDSVNFWAFVSKHYANDPWVFFDIFNEPVSPTGTDDAYAWQCWQQGCTINGVTYVGMQQLVNTIRQNAPSNLIFAEGLAAGEDIILLPNYLLTGGNIVYAIHPYFGPQHQSPSDWDTWFGNTASNGNFPVVADEWNEYNSATKGECLSNGPALVPEFLSYLQQKNIGLIAWALAPGLLITQSNGTWNYTVPTSFAPGQTTWTCQDPFPPLNETQGSGALIQAYFAQLSRMP
jgi:hypothetical protein